MIYGHSYLHETLSALTMISLKRSLLPKPVVSPKSLAMYIAETEPRADVFLVQIWTIGGYIATVCLPC